MLFLRTLETLGTLFLAKLFQCTPALSKHAILIMTKVELELISEAETYLFF